MNKAVLKSKIKEAYLVLKYYSFIPRRKLSTPSVIIMFNNKIMHGGLLDRIKGILSASIIAEDTGAEFKIFTDNSSFNLFHFLRPVNQKAVASTGEMIYNRWVSKPVIMYNIFSFGKQEILSQFKSRHTQYHLYCNTNMLKQFFPQADENELNRIWREQFYKMFHFDDYFPNYYRQLFDESDRVCGIHLRFISLLGDFLEVRKTALAEADQIKLTAKCISEVALILQQKQFNKYLVVSDSAAFLASVKKAFPGECANGKIVVLGGSIAHVDVDHSADVLQKAILDFYLLSRCSQVYQVLEERMYNSQFSRYAAVLGNAPYTIRRI